MSQNETHTNTLEAAVELVEGSLRACIQDTRSDIVAQFTQLSHAQQTQLARDAWMIGLSAVMNAYSRAEGAKLADVGETLVQDLNEQLGDYLAQQERAIQAALSRFFDPQDGQVTERLQAFLADEGVLARVLQQYVGADGSVLAETLAAQVGEHSPLFKKLSPTESEGLIQLVSAKVEEALASNRDDVARALDPLQKDGAVARFLTQLREQIEGVDEDRQAQLVCALAALDQNDENSLISSLMRETRQSHTALRDAINPQIPDSPMAQVKKTLEETLAAALKSHEERLSTIQEEQRTFQAELRAAVERIETRRTEQARSAHGGTLFEDEVVELLTRVVPSGLCTVEKTGNKVGLRPNCKVGDAVVRFTEEAAFAGCGVVIEAKRDRSYQVSGALDELETAMNNRAAEVGLFVMAKESAPIGFPTFARYGSRILVIWDSEDPVSDGLLRGAIVAALALAKRRHTNVDQGDLTALSDIEQRIFKEVERIEKMNKSAGVIRSHADKIVDELRKGRGQLERLIDSAKTTLQALNIELRDEQAEIERPIVITSESVRSENITTEPVVNGFAPRSNGT